MNTVLPQRIFQPQQNVQGQGTKVFSLKQSKPAIDLAILAYATEHAGIEVDLDRDLERAGIECLVKGD
jgi:hypothetical protein